jgi:hypothetical protein
MVSAMGDTGGLSDGFLGVEVQVYQRDSFSLIIVAEAGYRCHREDTLIRIKNDDNDWLGLAAFAAAGIGLGVIAGVVLGEFLGRVDGDRLRATVRRLRRPVLRVQPEDIEAVRREVQGALDENPKTRGLDVSVRALGEGIVELTGAAPDPEARDLAGSVARGVSGTYVVVNRMLVEDGVPSVAG